MNEIFRWIWPEIPELEPDIVNEMNPAQFSLYLNLRQRATIARMQTMLWLQTVLFVVMVLIVVIF